MFAKIAMLGQGEKGEDITKKKRVKTTQLWFLGLFPVPPGKSEVEEWSDMYTVTSQLMLKVHKEDDGVPVICQVEHPAVTGNLQTQRYLEVQCESLS